MGRNGRCYQIHMNTQNTRTFINLHRESSSYIQTIVNFPVFKAISSLFPFSVFYVQKVFLLEKKTISFQVVRASKLLDCSSGKGTVNRSLNSLQFKALQVRTDNGTLKACNQIIMWQKALFFCLKGIKILKFFPVLVSMVQRLKEFMIQRGIYSVSMQT